VHFVFRIPAEPDCGHGYKALVFNKLT